MVNICSINSNGRLKSARFRRSTKRRTVSGKSACRFCKLRHKNGESRPCARLKMSCSDQLNSGDFRASANDKLSSGRAKNESSDWISCTASSAATLSLSAPAMGRLASLQARWISRNNSFWRPCTKIKKSPAVIFRRNKTPSLSICGRVSVLIRS